LKKLLTIVLPLVLPTLGYLAWAWLERRRQARTEAGQPLSWWMTVPWVWTLCAGVVLMGITLATVAVLGGTERGGDYHPAVFEDGRIVPGNTSPPVEGPPLEGSSMHGNE